MPFYAPRQQSILTPLFLMVIVAVSHSAVPSGTVPTVAPATLITSSVKLRVDDANGHSWGTGTIIDTRQSPYSPTGQEALILTCGHIFRESQGQGYVEVHLFGENSIVRVYGRCVFYDLEIDLALVAIAPPGPVRAIPIAPEGYQIQPFQQVWSVGCDHGGHPTLRTHQIMSVDRISTPRENRVPFHHIQVSGAPVSGRSGGGLFSANGYLIGVCSTACPTVNDGHFVPPHMIRHVLDKTNLAFVYQNPSLGEPLRQPPPPMQLAALTPLVPLAPLEPIPTVPPMAMASVPAPMFADNQIDMRQIGMVQGGMVQGGMGQVGTEQGNMNQEGIERHKQDGSEAIVIIRSPRNPEIPSDVIAMNRASEGFLVALVDSPAQPTEAMAISVPMFPDNQASIGQVSMGQGGMSREEQATLEEITRRKQDGAEVIVIIRSPRNPEIPSAVIVMNGASDRFLDALVNSPAQPANPAYNSVIFSSRDVPARATDRQPVSFPVRH